MYSNINGLDENQNNKDFVIISIVNDSIGQIFLHEITPSIILPFIYANDNANLINVR